MPQENLGIIFQVAACKNHAVSESKEGLENYGKWTFSFIEGASGCISWYIYLYTGTQYVIIYIYISVQVLC